MLLSAGLDQCLYKATEALLTLRWLSGLQIAGMLLFMRSGL